MKDLLRADQQFREDTVNVVPIPGVRGDIDRAKIRPWHVIPNIRKFVIELRPFDWLLRLFDLRKRQPNKLTYYTWLNGEANVYLDYMFDRLAKQVELKLHRQAVATIWLLMGSTAYQVASINHVMRNWHRKLTWKEVMVLARQVNRLVKQRATHINYSRVYIPKGETYRPLGVPTPAWRVYLHMYNNCLVQWRLVTEPNKQHGYLPGKGVITAWQEITKLLKSRNIYEADYKQFFPSVKLQGIRVSLLKSGFPLKEALFIEELNASQPKLPATELLDESKTRRENEYHNRRRTTGTDPSLSALMYTSKQHHDWAFTTPEGLNAGVPQGAPTSCSLATWVLRSLYDLEVLFYADDLLYFPKSSDCNPVADLSIPKWGIEVHEGKSGWIKKDGIWQVNSFKFLGIRYFPGLKRSPLSEVILTFLSFLLLAFVLDSWTVLLGYALAEMFIFAALPYERFEADTRKGAKLAFSYRESFLSYLAIAREWMLQNPYLRKDQMDMSLSLWLFLKYEEWTRLKGKAKLLFYQKTLSSEQREKLTAYFSRGLERAVTKQDRSRYRHLLSLAKRGVIMENPLTGYLVSRMQANDWLISREQNFKLRYVQGSWMTELWPSYAWEWILPRNQISVFTASSFACHSLMSEIDHLKRGRPLMRRVLVTRWRNQSKHQLELLKILAMFRDNVG